MTYEQLKLSNQLCFPLYAISRLVTKAYKPLLKKLNLTYPQYLVMLVLWDKAKLSLKQISEYLLLESNTLTPLLKRMETAKLIYRYRLPEDERSVMIELTKQGEDLMEEAKNIPFELMNTTLKNEFSEKEIYEFKQTLDKVLDSLRDSNSNS